MIRRKKKHALGVAFHAAIALAVAIAAVACTHDFDAYQATGDGVTSPDASPEGSTTTGADGSSSLDGSTSVPDAAMADVNAVDAACATAPMCAATSTTCKATCDATETTCNAQCGSGGGSMNCKFKCKFDHDKCAGTCTTTCRTCAGTGCTAACN
ncbi:MAG: hypothetical protein JWO86_6289 [Myxococcaceae bacterium]|jgi:hypothetical protein|nr:hypothetical protein [Myxococcaceae bacterium]MEA2751228.1 hypothetical protein [Myxococcales bacterium]